MDPFRQSKQPPATSEGDDETSADDVDVDASGSGPRELTLEFSEHELQTSWTWPDANRGPRVLAFVIDTLILGAIAGLVQAVIVGGLQMFSEALPPQLATHSFEVACATLVRSLITVAYFIAFHYRSGQTPGKKLLGLRVVPASPADLEASFGRGLPFWRVLLRETVGRFASAFLLCYGYIRILIKDDRRGWHDQIAKTRVISISESESSPIRFKHIAMAGAALAVAAVGVRYYIVLYTPYPLRHAAASLERAGVVVDRIEGSLQKGYRVGRVYVDNPEYNAEFEDVSFAFSEGVSEPAPKKDAKKGEASEEVAKLELKDVVVRTAHIELRKIPQLADPLAPAPVHKRDSSLAELMLFAKSISFEELTMAFPDGRDYRLRNVSLQGLELKHLEQTIAFQRLWIQNEDFLCDLHDVAINPTSLTVATSSYVQIKPGLAPDVIVSPIDFQFTGKMEGSYISALDLQGFSRKLTVKMNGDNGQVVVNDLTPLHYLKTEMPIWSLNFRVAGDLRHMKFNELKGTMGLRNIRFDVDELAFLHSSPSGDKKYSLAPRFTDQWRAVLTGQERGFTLGSTDHLKARDLLADLYYGRRLTALNATELALVDKDVRFMADTAGALSAPPPKIIPLAVKKVAPKLPRATASAKQRTNRIPTSLPPYVKHQH